MCASSADVVNEQVNSDGRGRGCLSVRCGAVLLILLVVVGAFFVWTMRRAMAYDQDHIHPGVVVLGVDVGGLTTDEAEERLTETLGAYEAGALILSDGERTWSVPWAEAGLRFDVEATVQAAFAEGREGSNCARRGDVCRAVEAWKTFIEVRLRTAGERYEADMNPDTRPTSTASVVPVFTVDSGKVRRMLARLAPEVAVAPTDATLRLEGERLVAVPGQPGRALDVDATLANILATVAHLGPDNQFALTFRAVPPRIPDTQRVRAEAEEMLNRQVRVSTQDVLTGETFEWTLGRESVATWLRVEQAGDGSGPSVRIVEEAVRTTLMQWAAELGEGRGFRMEEATQQVLEAFEAGGGAVDLHMTHPPRTAVVQPGDDLTAIAARFGMPPGLIAEANPDVDLDRLRADQELVIPSEDVLRPYVSVPGKRIVIDIAEQRLRVYEDDALLHEWPVSTGMAGSPTYTGHFQILSKEIEAYASQWDLRMPHFMAVYRAGGAVYNGIHALPILSSGQRLWEGALGSPASYGCIILGVEEAETLYEWAEIGVPVIIE